MVGQQNADIADTLQLRDVAMATMFLSFYIWGVDWRHLANATEPSVCGGDAALCQITFTTCLYLCCVLVNHKKLFGCFLLQTAQLIRLLRRSQSRQHRQIR